MSDQHLAICLFLSPFAVLWAAFMTAETARVVAVIREDRRHGR